MEELYDALNEATNVKSLYYNKETQHWTIQFFNGEPNTVHKDNLIDFLENA